MPELKMCEVSYRDQGGIRHSIEVTAQTLYEAAALGFKALRPVRTMHALAFQIKVKQPETTHELSGAVLAAWLAMPGKTPKEQALKSRLSELMRSESS